MAAVEFYREHPLRSSPYNKLIYAGRSSHGVPLYRLEGESGAGTKAADALGRAFARHGGRCFYCGAKFKPQLFTPTTVGRDHVVPTSKKGPDRIHNLVIACKPCDRAKRDDPIYVFRPRSAEAYFAALEQHIVRCIRESEPS